jgi:hypothetical protein
MHVSNRQADKATKAALLAPAGPAQAAMQAGPQVSRGAKIGISAHSELQPGSAPQARKAASHVL